MKTMIKKIKEFLKINPPIITINLLSIIFLILLIPIIEIFFGNFNIAPDVLKYVFGIITVIMILTIPFNQFINVSDYDKKINFINGIMLIILVAYLYKYF